MKRELAIAANRDSDGLHPLADASRRKRVSLRLAFAACLALLAGCASPWTAVGEVWRDSARADVAPPGRTLVLALAPNAAVVARLEGEWVRQLRDRGIDAQAANVLLPDERPPSKERVVEAVRAGGFQTLLVSRLVDVKQVERHVSAHQVGVVETTLYDAGTQRRYWSARSDTLLANPTGERLAELRDERAHALVQALIEAMSKSKVL